MVFYLLALAVSMYDGCLCSGACDDRQTADLDKHDSSLVIRRLAEHLPPACLTAEVLYQAHLDWLTLALALLLLLGSVLGVTVWHCTRAW